MPKVYLGAARVVDEEDAPRHRARCGSRDVDTDDPESYEITTPPQQLEL